MKALERTCAERMPSESMYCAKSWGRRRDAAPVGGKADPSRARTGKLISRDDHSSSDKRFHKMLLIAVYMCICK